MGPGSSFYKVATLVNFTNIIENANVRECITKENCAFTGTRTSVRRVTVDFLTFTART
jgi:hypothetical protein